MLYRNDGSYCYTYGVDWRALVTLLVVVPINLPDLINAVDGNMKIGNYAYFCKSYEPGLRPLLQYVGSEPAGGVFHDDQNSVSTPWNALGTVMKEMLVVWMWTSVSWARLKLGANKW